MPLAWSAGAQVVVYLVHAPSGAHPFALLIVCGMLPHRLLLAKVMTQANQHDSDPDQVRPGPGHVSPDFGEPPGPAAAGRAPGRGPDLALRHSARRARGAGKACR